MQREWLIKYNLSIRLISGRLRKSSRDLESPNLQRFLTEFLKKPIDSIGGPNLVFSTKNPGKMNHLLILRGRTGSIFEICS